MNMETELFIISSMEMQTGDPGIPKRRQLASKKY